MPADDTAKKQQIGVPFQKGQSGNPAGRPKGAKSKLQEDFLRDVLEAWEAKGPQAINGMISEKPHEFVKMVAGLMPKEATLNINDHSEMTDGELAERVRALATQLAPILDAGIGSAEEGTGGTSGTALPSSVH